MLKIKGSFNINGIDVPNIITDEGEEAFLKMLVRDEQGDVAAGGNFYIGLTTDIGVANDATLASLGGELLSDGGYARKPITRDASGWPSITQVNGIWRARSATVNFAASGDDFSAAYTRAFLCNALSGTTGKLFAISGRLETAFLLEDGQNIDVYYELFLGYA